MKPKLVCHSYLHAGKSLRPTIDFVWPKIEDEYAIVDGITDHVAKAAETINLFCSALTYKRNRWSIASII